MKTCGDPQCVRFASGQRSGQRRAQSNFRLGAGGHECFANGDGTWTHYLCGGPEGDHTCVHHAGYCGYYADPPDRPVLDDAYYAEHHNAGPICTDETCTGKAKHRHPINSS